MKKIFFCITTFASNFIFADFKLAQASNLQGGDLLNTLSTSVMPKEDKQVKLKQEDSKILVELLTLTEHTINNIRYHLHPGPPGCWEKMSHLLWVLSQIFPCFTCGKEWDKRLQDTDLCDIALNDIASLRDYFDEDFANIVPQIPRVRRKTFSVQYSLRHLYLIFYYFELLFPKNFASICRKCMSQIYALQKKFETDYPELSGFQEIVGGIKDKKNVFEL